MSCLVAHDAAYYDADILHRDISVGNIMISEGGGGFLIDWDMCVRVGSGAQSSGRVERTGTWQFMSVALLQNTRDVHEILDDRESAFHVLTWSALRYTPHSSRDDVGSHMKPYDEVDVHRNGCVEGGRLKRDMIQNGLKVTFYPPELHNLIDELRRWFRERYKTLEPDVEIPLGEGTGAKITITDNLDAVKTHHDRVCEAMRQRDTLVRVFRQKLASGDWSEDCAAQDNYTRKRKALDQPTSSHHSSKSRKSNGGSRK